MRAEHFGTAATLCAVSCSTASGAHPPPSAAELSARADIEEAKATNAAPEQAQALRQASAEHRDAVARILEREARICLDVSEADRAHPPFLSVGGIEAVRPATGERRLVKTTVQELRGAELIIRANEGMTKQWVARVTRCHIAWHELVGARAPDVRDDPFLVGTPEISFDEDETSFIIRVRGNDKSEGEEILRRALLLAGRSPTP
jgi:hypothetical protein